MMRPWSGQMRWRGVWIAAPRSIGRVLALAALIQLTGCGQLPEPFLGNPGAAALRLRQPPDPRLAVPPAATALLSDRAGAAFAADLAQALRHNEVPAYAIAPAPTDWRLLVSAQDQGGQVIPSYTVLDPEGHPRGSVTGAPVATAAWAAADPATLRAAAAEGAPRLAHLLTGVETAIMRADPTSLYNRPARVLVAAVTGAPGDGDHALTLEMRRQLAVVGEQVVDKPAGADFVLRGQVKMKALPGGQQRVEIQWIVDTAKGKEGGRVTQLNDVPSGSLDRAWGDVAAAVAQQGAGGVREVILRQSRRE